MIECKKCKKQYIGETKRTLRERFSEHRQTTNTPLHVWVLSHLNYNLHPVHCAGKHEETDGMKVDHSNLNIVRNIYIIPYTYL